MIEFQPLAEGDLPQIEEWLRREHVARWWRDDIGESLAEYRAAIEGREPTDHYLVVVDGRPVGMVQTYLVSDYPDWEEIVRVGPGVAGVDILIGEDELIGEASARASSPSSLARSCSRTQRRLPQWRLSTSRTAAPGAPSRRPAFGTSATSRRTASRTA